MGEPKYPAQVVFTTTEAQRQAVQDLGERYADALGTSRAEILRRCIDKGLDGVARDLLREAVTAQRAEIRREAQRRRNAELREPA